MKIAMIGLGKMGANMSRRLLQGGHEVVCYDRDPAAVQALAREGVRPARDLADLARQLEPPRAVWVMVPAGAPTEAVVRELGGVLGRGDVVVDGGNSFFKDDIRRAAALAERGILFMDAGTSGGVWGLERGYCLMVGGEPEAMALLEPALRTLAPGRGSIPATPSRAGRESTAEEGFLHCGPVGSGHFVKMVHNGIEYGLMQAYAEGLDVLAAAARAGDAQGFRYDLDLADITEVWRRGSVISSWLLDLTADALAQSPKLEEYSGFVQDSGEGRWTIETAIDLAVPTDVLAASLFARFRSRQDHTFGERALSAMRHKFGGHVEPPAKP